MADTTENKGKLNDPFPDVMDEEYDGRSFVSGDNSENVDTYVGVDPVYRNYANVGEKPFPFSQEELDAAAARGGLIEENEDSEDDEDDEEAETKSLPAPESPKTAPAPTPQKSTTSRASAKDSKSATDDKK